MRERDASQLFFIHFFCDTNVVVLLINLGEPFVRRIHARMSDPQQFSELENHCHNFVRRGQALRSASGSPSGYGAKTSS